MRSSLWGIQSGPNRVRVNELLRLRYLAVVKFNFSLQAINIKFSVCHRFPVITLCLHFRGQISKCSKGPFTDV